MADQIATDVVIRERELVDISQLKKHPRNYRDHPKDQVAHLERSMQENGVYRNVVVANDYTILAGHGVAEAALEAGLTQVPVVVLPFGPDDPRALKVLTGDNELGLRAVVDDRMLSELLKEIRENNPVDGLLGTGYDDAMLANLLFVTRPASEIATMQEAEHWVGLPEAGSVDNPPRLVISFDSLGERAEFLKKVGIDQVHKKLVTSPTWSVWWPPRPREDLASLRFDEGEGVEVCP